MQRGEAKKLGQSLHSTSRTQTKCFVHFVRLFVEKGQFTFDISPNVLLAKRLAQTFCIFRTKCSAKRLEPNNSHGPNVLHKRLAPWRSRGTVLALGLAPRAPACLVGFRRTPQARGRSGVHTGTALEILVGRTTTRTAQCSHLDASPHPHCASV